MSRDIFDDLEGCLEGCLGKILALIISAWSGNSLGWVIIHACFGWLYIAYYALTHI